MPDAIGQFAKAKYLNLETFRKTGVGVRTPVWFAQDGIARRPFRPTQASVFYVYSTPDSGKVKRIRNNPRVRVAPCDIRGNLRGAWVDAHARLCEGAEVAHGQDVAAPQVWLDEDRRRLLQPAAREDPGGDCDPYGLTSRRWWVFHFVHEEN